MTTIREMLSRGWSTVLWVGPVAVLVAAALTFWSAQRALSHGDDDDLMGAAERVATAADLYIRRIVNDLTIVTSAPPVLDAAAAASAAASEPHVEKALDDYWQLRSGERNPELEERIIRLLNTAVSLHFKRIVATTGTVIRELLLADREGRLVAASVRTTDYLQGDDPWWPADLQGLRACGDDPSTCAQFGDVRWDDSASAYGVDVVIPVNADGELVGVLKAVVDPIELRDIARISDRFTEAALRKRDGHLLLERDSERFFTDAEYATYISPKRLRPGSETLVPRPEGNVAVRALTGAIGERWIVAVRSNRNTQAGQGWVVPSTWLTLTAIALLITAWAARWT